MEGNRNIEMKRISIYLLVSLLSIGNGLSLSAQLSRSAELSHTDYLRLFPGDLYLEYVPGEEGFHLWVKNKHWIGSIILTDYTSDPGRKQPVYSLRSKVYNPINGDEKRILEGKFLPQNLHSLIDSTPESNPYFPEGAFHIFIPFQVVYGYPWSRHGTKLVGKGSWVNVRTFRKSYGDYSGEFVDNPFVISIPMKKAPPPEEAPPEPEKKVVMPPRPIAKVFEGVDKQIENLSKNTIDVALVLDTTISMRDNIEFIRQELIPLVQEKIAKFDSFRIGIVLYRDYGAEYLTKVFPFSEDLKEVQQVLNEISVRGGGDIPEAVYEGIYSALTELEWQSNKRLLIQVGDAPPHPVPKGRVTKTMVVAKSMELFAQVQQIMLGDEEIVHTASDLKKKRPEPEKKVKLKIPDEPSEPDFLSY